ncbi:hypothetical protein [Mycobacterium sp.]|uniref:hypothetical protein n=1 Tax=Mycobacterium sp. TaxID=1785 RepID=UPI002CB17CF2|nr:hypothetical protein [Mycobacterium sp.]HTQ21989.1 hypothetical protein [Mycobacterium sp.]
MRFNPPPNWPTPPPGWTPGPGWTPPPASPTPPPDWPLWPGGSDERYAAELAMMERLGATEEERRQLRERMAFVSQLT